MSPSANRRRISRYALAAGVVAGIVSGIVYSVVRPGTQEVPVTILSILASTDMGRLPARGTGAGQLCGAIGTLPAPTHCYDMEEASGSLVDKGTGGLNLTAAGTPRYSVPAGAPEDVAGVASWGKKMIHSDGSGRFTGSTTAADTMALTVAWRAKVHTASHYIVDWGFAGGAGVALHVTSAGALTASAHFGTSTARAVNTHIVHNGALRCATINFNKASTAGWISGAAISWASAWGDYGSTTAAKNVGVMSTGAGASMLQGGVAFARLDYADQATEADHLALCAHVRSLVPSHAAYADVSWTQSGGPRAFALSATTASTIVGGLPGYRYHGASDYRWPMEQGRVNRLLYSSALQNWPVTGNPELLADGDCEAAGVGDWAASTGATVAKDAVTVHGGAQSLSVGTASGHAAIQNILTVGNYYWVDGWIHGDGASGGRVILGATSLFTSTAAAWVQFTGGGQCTTGVTFRLAQAPGSSTAYFDDFSVTLHSTPAIAPDGSKAAYTFASTATLTSPTATGYTASATLYPMFWLNCSAGTVSATAIAGSGDWDIDCTHAALNGNWALISRTHPAVSITTGWAASGAGEVNMVFTSTDGYSLWLPTLTEEEGYSVIPTTTAAVDTGDIAWSHSNTGGAIWKTGDVVTSTLSELAGTCLVLGTPLYLSGAVGSECWGSWNALEVVR